MQKKGTGTEYMVTPLGRPLGTLGHHQFKMHKKEHLTEVEIKKNDNVKHCVCCGLTSNVVDGSKLKSIDRFMCVKCSSNITIYEIKKLAGDKWQKLVKELSE